MTDNSQTTIGNASGIVGVILAGGASSRMGRDKAAIMFEGVSLLTRTVETLSVVVDRIVVVGLSSQRQQLFETERDTRTVGTQTVGTRTAALSISFIDDLHPGEGPLGGLITAFSHVPNPHDLLAVPIDLPFLHGDLLRRLLSAAYDPSNAINDDTNAINDPPNVTNEMHPANVVATSNGVAQPLLAIYRRSSQDAMLDAFAAGERSIKRISGLRSMYVDITDLRDAAQDVDTPQDLDRAVQRRRAMTTEPEKHRPDLH
jgi:molybdenum cofactor guanylyltransferase